MLGSFGLPVDPSLSSPSRRTGQIQARANLASGHPRRALISCAAPCINWVRHCRENTGILNVFLEPSIPSIDPGDPAKHADLNSPAPAPPMQSSSSQPTAPCPPPSLRAQACPSRSQAAELRRPVSSYAWNLGFPPTTLHTHCPHRDPTRSGINQHRHLQTPKSNRGAIKVPLVSTVAPFPKKRTSSHTQSIVDNPLNVPLGGRRRNRCVAVIVSSCTFVLEFHPTQKKNQSVKKRGKKVMKKRNKELRR